MWESQDMLGCMKDWGITLTEDSEHIMIIWQFPFWWVFAKLPIQACIRMKLLTALLLRRQDILGLRIKGEFSIGRQNPSHVCSETPGTWSHWRRSLSELSKSMKWPGKVHNCTRDSYSLSVLVVDIEAGNRRRKEGESEFYPRKQEAKRRSRGL